MGIERRRARYHGRVQGVGFRATARGLARGFALSGTVRNLSDGGVEVVAEGESAEVSAFLDAIASEMGAKVRGVEVEPLPAGDPPLSGFTILY